MGTREVGEGTGVGGNEACAVDVGAREAVGEGFDGEAEIVRGGDG